MKTGRRSQEKIFQECLDAVQQGEDLEKVIARYPRQAGELRKQFEAIAWIEQKKLVLAPREGFLPAARQRLLERIRGERASEITRPRDLRALKAFQQKRFWQVLNLISMAVLLLCMVFVGIQGYSFAETALPGDVLYGVKILGEKVHIGTTFDLAKKAELHVFCASRRSGEIVELIFEGRYEYLTPTSANLKGHVWQAEALLSRLEATDPSLSDSLANRLENTFAAQNLLLDLLVQSVPEEARLGVEEAMALAPR